MYTAINIRVSIAIAFWSVYVSAATLVSGANLSGQWRLECELIHQSGNRIVYMYDGFGNLVEYREEDIIDPDTPIHFSGYGPVGQSDSKIEGIITREDVSCGEVEQVACMGRVSEDNRVEFTIIVPGASGFCDLDGSSHYWLQTDWVGSFEGLYDPTKRIITGTFEASQDRDCDVFWGDGYYYHEERTHKLQSGTFTVTICCSDRDARAWERMPDAIESTSIFMLSDIHCPPESSVIPDFSLCLDQRDITGDGVRDCLLKEVEDVQGNKFQTWCVVEESWVEDGTELQYRFHYLMVYIPENGEPKAVGECKWHFGVNEGNVFPGGSNISSMKPDCFVGSRWSTIDDPGPNGDWDTDGDGKIDWITYCFDVCSFKVVAYFSESLDGPGGEEPDTPSAVPIEFDAHTVLNSLPSIEDAKILVDGQIVADTRPPCDLDDDGDCDKVDRQAFDQSLGKSIGESGYNAQADFDGDGYVTEFDLELILRAAQLDFNYDGISNLVDFAIFAR